mmetsp:Transcript_34891/g.31415  ORF Transcript_34891/g.31415 Transcript_34891/m.31415 type:complete len:171 (+) Transcript_34891:645-1157(+)
MLPKTKHRYNYLKNLHIFREETHTTEFPFLPRFAHFNQTGVISYDKYFELPPPEQGVIIYEEHPGEAAKHPLLKDYKVEPDDNFLHRVHETPRRYYKDKEYYWTLRQKEKWEKRAHRYRIIRAKRGSPIDLKELYKTESVLVDREWKALRFGFMDTIKEADEEPEDERDD